MPYSWRGAGIISLNSFVRLLPHLGYTLDALFRSLKSRIFMKPVPGASDGRKTPIRPYLGEIAA